MSTFFLALLISGCAPSEPVDRPGGQSGSLRDELPLPDDIDQIDIERAVVEAMRVAVAADLTAPWRAHLDLLATGDGTCPTLFLGAPEDAMADMEDDVISWAQTCGDGGLDFEGSLTWQTAIEETGDAANRSLMGEARVFGDNGLLFEFDGEGDDDASWGADGAFTYGSTIGGQVSGLDIYDNSAPVPGWRGESTLSYDDKGNLLIDANMFLFGQPLLDRFDAVVVDVEFTDACGNEPIGHVGLRGTDGYWFDVYFLPRYPLDEKTAASQAYPYDLIENPTCDACGTLFVRNVFIDGAPAVCPDFDAVRGSLVAPAVSDYILTLHELPWEAE